MNLALILPERRLWAWHQRLIDELSQDHSLAVFTSPGAPLPACLALLLRGEASIYGGPVDDLFVGDLGTPLQQVFELVIAEFDVVLDLTGVFAPSSTPQLQLRYNGCEREDALFACLAKQRPPLLEVVDGDDHVIAGSYAALEVRTELARSLRLVHARLLALVSRAVQRLNDPTLRPFGEVVRPVSLSDDKFSCAKVASFAASAMKSKAIEKLQRSSHWSGLWSLAIRRQTEAHPPWVSEGYLPLKASGETFLADPCLHVGGGRTHLFAEALAFGKTKGFIVCSALTEDGEAGEFRTVLEEDHHLSYPLVFNHDGEIFMVPESGAIDRVDLYRAIAYPGVWRRERTLISGRKLVDSTLFQHEGLWWLFAGGSEHGGSTHDELFGFHSESLVGPWSPCRKTPMRSDCRSSRPAGAILKRNGRLFRPSQDNEARYGGGLKWAEILKLDPDTYVEQPVAALTGADFGPYQGVHTYSQGGGFEVVDLLRTHARR